MSSIDLLVGLHIAVAVVLLIILYHVLFAVVNLRKITKQSENVTKKVEEVVMQPIAIAENAFKVVSSFVEHSHQKDGKKKTTKKKK